MTQPPRFQGAPRTMQLVGEKGAGPKWLEDHAIRLEHELVEACVILRRVILNKRDPEAIDLGRRFIEKFL